MAPSSDPSWSANYNLIHLGVASGTPIASRTSTILTHLTLPNRPAPTDDDPQSPNKIVVVQLTAVAKASTKLISIVEIVKRDCRVRASPLFQYTALSSRWVDVPVPVKDAEPLGDDESDDAFEVMGGGGLESEVRRRNVPVLTVYLSTVPVKELRVAYG
jgi:hypothetical protein